MAEQNLLKSAMDTVGLTEENKQKIEEAGSDLFGKLSEEVEKGKKKLGELKSETDETISGVVSGVGEWEQGAEDEVAKKLKMGAEKLGDFVGGTFSDTFSGLERYEKETEKGIVGEIEKAKDTVDEFAANFGQVASEKASGFAEFGKKAEEKITETLDDTTGKMNEFVRDVGGALPGIASKFGEFGEKTKESITDKLDEAKDKVGEFDANIGGMISEKANEFGEFGHEFGKKAEEKITETLDDTTGKMNEFVKDVGETLPGVASKFGEFGEKTKESIVDKLEEAKNKVGEFDANIGGIISEKANEFGEFGHEFGKNVTDKMEKGKEKLDEFAKNRVDELGELKERADEKMAEIIAGDKEKVEGYKEVLDEEVNAVKEKVGEKEKGLEDYLSGISSSVRETTSEISGKIAEKVTEGKEYFDEKLGGDAHDNEKSEELIEKTNFGQLGVGASEGNTEGATEESKGYFGGIDFTNVGDALKGAAEDLSGKITEKFSEGYDLLEGKLHDEEKDSEKQSQEPWPKIGGVDFTGMGSALKGMTEDISQGISGKIREAKEHMEEKLYGENKDTEVEHGQQTEREESGNEDLLGGTIGTLGKIAGDFSEKVSEKMEEGKEFLTEKIYGSDDAEKRIVHEHMGGIYVKDVDETKEESGLPEEKPVGTGNDFLGAADFGGLQSTMKDVFSKGVEKVKEAAEAVLPESGHNKEPRVVKKILPEGTDVPEQVGILSESGIYHDDYEPMKLEGGLTTKLEDFLSGKVGDVDKILEEALNIQKKPDESETVNDLSQQQGEVQQEGTEGAIVSADEMGETFQKLHEFGNEAVNLDDSKMESSDSKTETQHVEEERRHLDSTVPEPSPIINKDEHVDAPDGSYDGLSGSTDQMAPPVPQHQELTDLLSGATKHAEEKVHEVISESIHQDLSQHATENVEPESGSNDENAGGASAYDQGMLDERVKSSNEDASDLAAEEPDMFGKSSASPPFEFPEGFSARQRSVSLSSEEESLREQLTHIESSVPIPVKIETQAEPEPEKVAEIPFGVAGPGEILIETVLVPAPLLCTIASETEIVGDTDKSEEQESQHSGHETTPESDFIAKRSLIMKEKEIKGESNLLADLPHPEENKKRCTDEGVTPASDALTSVPEHPISENIPSAIESSTLENMLKFSAAPVVHDNTAQPTVQPTAQFHDEMITKTEIKSLHEKAEAEPQGSGKSEHGTASLEVKKEEPKPKEETKLSAEASEIKRSAESAIKKTEEKHEPAQKSTTETQKAEVTPSLPAQKPEAPKADVHPAEPAAEAKLQEATDEKAKTDTLKSKDGDGQQQQQPARRRCTIL